jgi:hypothetical protein
MNGYIEKTLKQMLTFFFRILMNKYRKKLLKIACIFFLKVKLIYFLKLKLHVLIPQNYNVCS